MKILFVAMPNSIHTARWISQLKDRGWDLHIYPGYLAQLHPDIGNVNYHLAKIRAIFLKIGTSVITSLAKNNKLFFLKPDFIKKFRDHRGLQINNDLSRAKELVKLIQKIKPDIVHSMEFQINGYLTLQAKKIMKQEFPLWIATNWGSDIYLYGKFPEHREKIKELLSSCDFYSCETARDARLAEEFGFCGTILPIIPNSGGFDLKKLELWKSNVKPSKRKIIMLKGYQGWAGRALVGIRALERCSDLLTGYHIVVYTASGTDIEIASKLFSIGANVDLTILPPGQTHETIMRYHGMARISIGLSISDAISTSFLEAIAMGSFPIQSNTACAEEWIIDGRTGIIVPSEDPEIIERAIRRALSDDEMVDRAAEENWQTVVERLDHNKVKNIAIGMYEKVFNEQYSKYGKLP